MDNTHAFMHINKHVHTLQPMYDEQAANMSQKSHEHVRPHMCCRSEVPPLSLSLSVFERSLAPFAIWTAILSFSVSQPYISLCVFTTLL